MPPRGKTSAIALLFWPAISLVQAQDTFKVSTTSVKLTYTLLSEVVPSQQITVSTTGAPVQAGVSVLNDGTPSPFLAVTPTGCTTMCTLTVAAASATAISVLDALMAGVTYTASFQLIAAGVPPSPVVNVTLTVLSAAPAGPTITASPSSLFGVAPECSSPAPAARASHATPDAGTTAGCFGPTWTVALTSNGTSDVTLNVATSQGLSAPSEVSLLSTGGGGASLLTVIANPADFGPVPGPFTGSINLSLPGASKQALTIPVSLLIAAPGTPIPNATPPSLALAFRPGESAQSQPLTVNAQNGVPTGSISVSASSSCGPNEFQVDGSGQVDAFGNFYALVLAQPPAIGSTPSGATCGGALAFNASGIGPFTIPLAAFTRPRSKLVVTPGSVSLSRTSPTAVVLVTTDTGVSVPFTESPPQGYLFASPISGTTPQLVTIHLGFETDLHFQAFPDDHYTFEFPFQSDQAESESASVRASGSQRLSTSPTQLTFNVGQGVTVAQNFTISGLGPVTLTPGANWLSLEHSTLTLSDSGGALDTATVNTTGLEPGTVKNTCIGLIQGSNSICFPVTLVVSSTSTFETSPPVLIADPLRVNAAYVIGLGLDKPFKGSLSISPESLATINPSSVVVTDQLPTGYVVTCKQGQSGVGRVTVADMVGNVVANQLFSCSNTPSPFLRSDQAGSSMYLATGIFAGRHAHASHAVTIPSDTITISTSKNPGASYVLIAPDWLTVTPATGTLPQTITVTGNLAVLSTLSPGSYVGDITIAAAGVPDPLTIPVNVVIGSAAAVTVVNAASTKPGPVSPGELISVFGTDIGPTPAVGLALTPTGLVSTTLDGTQVLFDGVPAPLAYAGSGQINAIVPHEAGGKQFTNVTVQKNGATVGATVLAVADWNPAIFTFSGAGTGQGAIRNQDNSANGTSNPAAAGSIITIFATGEGALAPTLPTGSLTSSTPPFPAPVGPVSVTIGGKPAAIQYAGEAPGEVAGLFQLDVTIPPGTPSGRQPVVVTVGNNNDERQNITVAVK